MGGGISYVPQGPLVIGDQLFLLFFRLTPVTTGAHEIRLDSAFRARPDDLILKLFLLSPLAYAVQAVENKRDWLDCEIIFSLSFLDRPETV